MFPFSLCRAPSLSQPEKIQMVIVNRKSVFFFLWRDCEMRASSFVRRVSPVSFAATRKALRAIVRVTPPRPLRTRTNTFAVEKSSRLYARIMDSRYVERIRHEYGRVSHLVTHTCAFQLYSPDYSFYAPFFFVLGIFELILATISFIGLNTNLCIFNRTQASGVCFL